MALGRLNGEFEVKPLPILGQFNVQRFKQYSPEDCANWYLISDQDSKLPYAMYPCLGRAHINYLGDNKLLFGSQPRATFKTISYSYIVEGNTIYQMDGNYNLINIAPSGINTTDGNIYFTYLIFGSIVFACFVDTENVYIYQEESGLPLQTITDPLCPGGIGSNTKPGFIAAFGNRITVSIANSSLFNLAAINLQGKGATNPTGLNFDPAKCFTNFNTPAVFAQEEGIIRQMGVLNNTLYIYCDFITGVWSNITATFSGTGQTFPWKKNSTYNWNFGIANPKSLDINFGLMVFLARNSEGLLMFVQSSGGQPEPINTKAVSTMMQNYVNRLGNNSPFLLSNSNGFLYQYEDVILYRFSGGEYFGAGILDQQQKAVSIQYSFETKTWHRCIELNGERNRIQEHVYFNNQHLVTVIGETTIYNMSGQYYYNEVRNELQPDPEQPDAYIAYPFRYERTTPIIFERDYSEFETEFVQIDFVFGISNILYSTAAFSNTQFLITEDSSAASPNYIIAENTDSDGLPVYIVAEQGNTPGLQDNFYNTLLNPNVELYWSDDGGQTFNFADNLTFAQQGQYQWRIRWYQLGCSRNRVYKLVSVSVVPIVVLGGSMNVRRVSGGAY